MSRRATASSCFLSSLLLTGVLGCSEARDFRETGLDPSGVTHARFTHGSAQKLSLTRAVARLPKQALSRSMQGLSSVPLSGGVRRLHLAGRFQHASVAVTDGEGQPHVTCVDGPVPSSDAQDER